MFKIFIIALCFVISGCAKAEITEETPSEEDTAPKLQQQKKFYTKEYIENLSNSKQSWGMRRNPGGRPEFTNGQKLIMDKYGCIYMGSDEEKYIYLTFDEGYENGQTERILDVLKQKNVTAAFFITGDYFKAENALVDRMVNEGHIVGNHTMNHPCIPDMKQQEKIEKEVLSLDLAFYEHYGMHMSFFRPPEGAYSEKSLAVTENLGYTNVFWSFAYDDWYRNKSRGADYAYNKTMDNIHPGCVILLHAVSKDNADALGRIIDSARERGYEFLPLTEYIP